MNQLVDLAVLTASLTFRFALTASTVLFLTTEGSCFTKTLKKADVLNIKQQTNARGI